MYKEHNVISRCTVTLNNLKNVLIYHSGNSVAKVLCVWLLLAGALSPLNIGFLLTIWRCLAASGPSNKDGT